MGRTSKTTKPSAPAVSESKAPAKRSGRPVAQPEQGAAEKHVTIRMRPDEVRLLRHLGDGNVAKGFHALVMSHISGDMSHVSAPDEVVMSHVTPVMSHVTMPVAPAPKSAKPTSAPAQPRPVRSPVVTSADQLGAALARIKATTLAPTPPAAPISEERARLLATIQGPKRLAQALPIAPATRPTPVAALASIRHPGPSPISPGSPVRHTTPDAVTRESSDDDDTQWWQRLGGD
jgi:hypothetical protein